MGLSVIMISNEAEHMQGLPVGLGTYVGYAVVLVKRLGACGQDVCGDRGQ